MTLTPQNKATIDAMNVEQLLSKQRFASIGDPWYQGETGEYLMKRLADVRARDHDAYVAASKTIGW